MARTSTGSRSSKGAFNFSVTVNPSPEKLARAYGVAAERFKDYRAAFKLLAPFLAEGLRRNVLGRGGPIGEQWPSASASWHAEYLRRKAREGFGVLDLIMIGRMFAQMTSATQGVMSMGMRSMRFGTDAPYARALNFGNQANRNRRRMFMGWSDYMKASAEEVLTEFTRHLLQLLVDDVNAEAARG